jgi:non-ribosomal peptide synthetase component F
MSDRIPNDKPVKHAQSPLLTEAKQQVAAWNATQQGYPRDANVAQLVAAQAAATPNAVALTAGAEVLTYAQLDTRANQLAHYLRGFGVGPDVVVAICLERSLSLVVGALAILKAGGAYLPLDPSYPPSRLACILIDAQPHVLLTHQSMAERLPAGGWRVVALDVDGPLIARHPSESPTSQAMTEHLAYVIYTSGSTGQPKGVQITHDSLLNLVFWHQRTFTVTSADRATQQTAPGFDAAVWELWPYLAAGASVHLPDEATRNTPESLRDWLVSCPKGSCHKL